MSTEAEAREKWCPMVRVGDVFRDDNGNNTAASFNRCSDGTFSSFKCVASSCMMWRWKGDTVPDPKNSNRTIRIQTQEGYCGLAGHFPLFPIS